MRTPKQKKSAPKSKRGGDAANKLRKKAMRSKMMKKTLLAVGGDRTREDIRDLMNESELSVCVAKDNLEPDMGGQGQNLVLKLSPEKPKEVKEFKEVKKTMKKSLSMVGTKTKEATEELTNGILKRTRSLRSIKSKRKLPNEENIDFTLATEEKKVKIEETEVAALEEKVENIPNAALSKLAGVKSLITNAVWGVPYAKVVEDLDISAVEPELETEDNPGAKADSNCVIS